MFGMWFERKMPSEFVPLLAEVATVVGAASETPDNPFAALSEAHAVIAGGQISYDAAFMDQAPHLRIIARTGIGVDKVAIPEATARGVAVCNTPDAPTISTAEHAIGLMFAVAKQVKWSDRILRQGDTADIFNRSIGLELYQARLGLVGLGRIGSRVAKLAQGIGMRVMAYDPFVTPERAAELGVDLAASLDEVLQDADVVSVHVPLLPETRHLINGARLAQMKPGAILINAARGGVVDELALVKALDQGRLLGAGFDVFTTEPPPPDHPLVGRDDVVVTPHIAAATAAGKNRLWHGAIVQALQVLKGERPPHLINPEVWPPGN